METPDNDEDKAHLMKETLDILVDGGIQAKDYRDMFNHAYLVKWMEKLLGALETRKVRNAVIVMDKAKYHKSLPEGTPRKGWKKAALLEFCRSRSIPTTDEDTKSLLWPKIESYIKQHIKPMIVAMAEAKGHEILFSPPHYSDLQPIETVWAIVKGEVGRQYTDKTTFDQVLDRSQTAFNNVTSEHVQDCINKANRRLWELRELIRREDDAQDESGTDCSDSSANSDSGSDSDSESEALG